MENFSIKQSKETLKSFSIARRQSHSENRRTAGNNDDDDDDHHHDEVSFQVIYNSIRVRVKLKHEITKLFLGLYFFLFARDLARYRC